MHPSGIAEFLVRRQRVSQEIHGWTDEGGTMRETVAHFGNMANDAYPVVEELQALGEDVQLYVSLPSPVTALPEWELLKFELGEVGGDPYFPKMEVLDRAFKSPEWLHFINLEGGSLSRFRKLRKEMKKYDLIVSHVPFFVYSYLLRTRYIAFEAGAIRYFGHGTTLYQRIRLWLMERSYRHAEIVLMTNPDTIDLCEEHKLNWEFIPFAINMQRYRPMHVGSLGYDNVILCFSRHNWKEKGQDKLIRAFARFVSENKDSLLVLVEWGQDLARSKELVVQMDIQKHVKWIPMMSKPFLVEWINRSTVVADQFNLGSSGTAGFEAMACGRPLIIYLSPPHYNRVYDEFPPILNSQTEDDILRALDFCGDKKARNELGRKSRLWVSEHHGATQVAKKHLAVYERVLAE
jgi:glycosyltransferase involved in cell wall biosynthesis